MNDEHYPDVTLEETYKGYVIYLENNPDQYTGGYEFSISDSENILHEGLEFDAETAFLKARELIDSMIQTTFQKDD